ncbi:MAG: DUF2066 domain-containing protein [Gammaproteobacteria bacterium]|nr:DUF2066 domain-containing protein [Gammaproteobacteria bacterium]
MSLIVGLGLGLWVIAAMAEETGDLYSAETRVADEGSETRNAALSELLATVLVRVSGNTGIAGQPAARDLLASAPSLVQQYRYRTAEQDGAVVRYLVARFDQQVIEPMMRERNLPVWVQRPRVLLWVATEQAGQRILLNLEYEPQARAATLSRAQQRGMPLQLPLMDLEDQGKLTPADLWSDYQAGILQASARYPHEVVLAGRLSAQRGKKWSGVWSLIGRDGSDSFQTPAQGLDDALAFAIDQAQNLLAARYAPLPGVGGGSGTLVRFSDVYDLAAYGRLVALLDSLEPVSQVALRHVNRDSFLFELQLRSDEQNLARALEAGGQVVAEPVPVRLQPAVPQTGDVAADPGPSAVEPEADLYYRLLN